jgi:hypothetical protein
MKADQILEIATEIVETSIPKSKKAKHFEVKYKEFAEGYPVLYEKCCSSDNMNTLNYMISMLKKIEENKMTESVASANVGQKLYNDYVKPLVGEDEGKK